MSKFLNYFKVEPISDVNVYLGFSPDSVPGTIINTVNQNTVIRKELSNKKIIQSWTAEYKLSHKVVYDFKSKKYVGIYGNRHLRFWGEEEQEIQKVKKQKLPRPVTELISFDDKHTILLYRDGTCESLENRLNENEANWPPIVDHQAHTIINIACVNTFDNHVMMTYFLQNKQTGAIEFVYFLLNDDNLTPTDNVRRIKIARNEVTLAAFTVVDVERGEREKLTSVMTIWSDKRIFMLPIAFDEPTPTDAGSFVHMFHDLRVDKSMTMVSVGKNCVLIYGGNTKQDGASLVLYNTRHHVVSFKQHVKVHLDNCRLWVIGTYILMAVGQRLTCTRFRIAQEKLSDIIGSKRSIEFSGGNVNRDCINEDIELEDYVSVNREALGNNDAVVQAKSVLREHNESNGRVEPQRPELFEKFNNDLSTLYRFDIAIDLIRGGSLADLMKLKPVTHPQDQLYSNEEIASLVGLLENCGSSETEITEHVIPLLITAKLPKELAISLRKYTNVSERMLAKSMKFFINMEESDEKLAFINQVFACSFHEDLIKEHLRTNLNLDNAIYLLKHIHQNLLDQEMFLEESPQYGNEFDSDTVLINWFIVILDAHYQQFLLARDPTIIEMVLKWKQLVESFIYNIHELKPIEAKLQNLLSGKAKVNSNTGSKWYSVEKIKLY